MIGTPNSEDLFGTPLGMGRNERVLALHYDKEVIGTVLVIIPTDWHCSTYDTE